MLFKPRYYQIESVDAIFEYFMHNDGNPLVVLPTASGKSLVQAMIADRLIKEHKKSRILFLTHQQELIRQNYDELIYNFGICDAGIYSAGLKSRDTFNQIIFAGIQSVYNRSLELGCFNLIVIDECHLVPKKGNGMYLKFISDMKNQYSSVKIIGLTATEYRLDSGLLTDGQNRIFTEVIYKIPVIDLINKGYLCRPIGKNGIVSPDLTGVHKRGGDYIESELSIACDKDEIVKKAVTEIIKLTENRKHILLFCASILHAEHVAEEMTSQGMPCAVIHSKISGIEQQKIIDNFKRGDIRSVANVDMLTIGFNARHIDCIIMLRPTASTGLYYQMCGRGLRMCDEKENCLILDYAGNIMRHGPIDEIVVKSKGKLDSESGIKTAPTKICPSCQTFLPIMIMECPECGYIFPDNPTHDDKASDESPLSSYKTPYEYDVESINYYVHEKNDRVSMRVSYYTSATQSVSEWVCIEHDGYAKIKAIQWMKEMLPAGHPIPDTVEESIELKNIYKKPNKIIVDYNKDFPRIIARIYNEENIEESPVKKISKSFVR